MEQTNRQKLNLPEFEFKLKIEDDKEFVFDELRKKYIMLTPEEWVRQNIIKYLTDFLEYPKHLIGVEKQINVFNTIKRPDIIIFDRNLSPLMIVECKKPKIKLNQETFNQTINYFIELQSKYFLISNGLNHYCCKIENKSCTFLNEIPKFDNL